MDAMEQRKRFKLLGKYVQAEHYYSEEGPNFINKLPDALLVDIISILPLQEAVRTSILSKRWNHLWKSIQNIQLIFPTEWFKQKLADQAACALDPFFRHHQAFKIRRFNLKCPGPTGNRLSSWIHFAFSHHVEEFWADCWSIVNNKIPGSCVFESQWLTELRLINFNVQIPSSVYLPSLKTLYLHNLGPDVSATEVGFIISKCPSLENLSVRLFRTQKGSLRISVGSSRFRTLTVRHHYQILIDAPTVQSLELQDKLPSPRDMGNMSSLSRLCLTFRCYYNGVGDELKKTLVEYHHVRYIKLSKCCVGILSATTNMITMMATCLELMISLTATAQLRKIKTVLSFFPAVETLILGFESEDNPLTRQSGWESMKHSFVKALQRIKTIVMHDFISIPINPERATLDNIWSSCEAKIELVRTVLQKSTCLDKVVITLSREFEYNEWSGKAHFRLMLMEKLQCSNRASPGAKIFVY